MRDRDIAVATPPGVVAPPIVEESDSPHQFESEMVVSDFLDCSVDESIGQQRHRPPASRRPPGPANEALHAYFVLLSSFGAFVLFALAFQKGRSGDEPRGAKASVGRRQRRRPSEKRPPRGATKGRLARSIGGTVAPVAPFALAPAAPALLVLLGVALGSSCRESADGGGGGPPSFALGSFLLVVQSLVNDVAVPLYAAAALVYLLVLAKIRWERRRRKYPTQRSAVAVVPSEPIVPPPPPSSEKDRRCVDLSGSYKLRSNENFTGFLAAQGVPYLLRSAADKAVPTHVLTHTRRNRGEPDGGGGPDTLRIRITGIITGDTTYAIGNGEIVETKIRDRTFRDAMSYLPEGDGVIVKKTVVGVEDEYRLEVTRRLVDGGATMRMESRLIYAEEGRDDVVAVQTFGRL